MKPEHMGIMNEEAQRIAIAKACGWTNIIRENKGEFGGLRGDPPFDERQIVPSFCRDLNAMNKAEKTLNVSDEQIMYWESILENICDRDNTITLMATAAQRAEAFLKTLNLWKE